MADDDLLLLRLRVLVGSVLCEHFLPVFTPSILTVDWRSVSLSGPAISPQDVALSPRDGQTSRLSHPAPLYLHLTAQNPQLGEIFPPEETFFLLYGGWLGFLFSQTFRSVKQILKLVEKVLNYLCCFLLIFLKMENISILSSSLAARFYIVRPGEGAVSAAVVEAGPGDGAPALINLPH